MAKTFRNISWQRVKKLSLPLSFFLLTGLVYFLYKFKIEAFISEKAQEKFQNNFSVLIILIVALFAQKIIEVSLDWYKEEVVSKTNLPLDKELIPLLRRVTKVGVWTIALLIILPIYGVNIAALATTLGVGSLAVALAAQDTIANIISGFMLMLDRPFRIGDKIKLPSGEKVRVLEVGIRRSKFLAEDNSVIIVPNLDLSKSKMVNYTYGEETDKKSS